MVLALALLVVVAVVAYFLFFNRSSGEQITREREVPPPSTRVSKEPTLAAAPPKSTPDAAPEVSKPPEQSVEVEDKEDVAELPPSAVVKSNRALAEAHDVEGIRRGLARSRDSEGFFGRLKTLFTGKSEIDADIAERIEEVLLSSDVGVQTTSVILERIKRGLGKGELNDADKVWAALRQEMLRILSVDGKAGTFELNAKPTILLLVGVNGAGKTTTIGKLATKLKAEGHDCVLAAGDTFRAAAVQQLIVWGQRIGCEVVHGKEGADPGSVVFDAIRKAEETGAHVVLADTAGRLHTKANLMSEMQKIARTAAKAMPSSPHETFLVIDATNGQNALSQAREFKEALTLTGIVLTKLDGTAKGGMVLGICDSLGLPVRFIGLGERPDDLHEFDPNDFVEALLGKEAAS